MAQNELIWGVHAIKARLQKTPHEIIELYILKSRFDQITQEVIHTVKSHGISVIELDRQKLDQLVNKEQHQGIVAKCRIAKRYTENDLEYLLNQISCAPFLLILDEVQDPHNLGACLRTANGAGVHIVIAPQDRSAGLTPVARKVACGAAEETPFIQVTNLARTLRELKQRGIWLYGAADKAQQSLYQVDLVGPIALILGSEGKGLRRLTREYCDYLISIPMAGNVNSLNVSVATGVCLFEVVRQRSLKA